MSDELSIPRNPVYRVPRRRGLDTMTRRLMLIAGGLSGALVLIVALWSSVGHHGGQVPVVQADQRPVRVKPANPGGMQIPGLSADGGAGTATASADGLAPAPETPDPQGLARQQPRPAPAAATAAPVSAAALTSAPLHAGIAAAPVTRVSAAQAAAKPAQVATAAMADRHVVPAVAHGPVGRAQVQFAAVGTETAARQEWDRLAHRMPSVIGTHHPMFTKVERDGHTLWRVRTGDFATEAEAGQFCQEVKAKGGGCAIAAF
jgi:hypothetical protein